MFKKISKGDTADFDGVLIEKKHFEKLQKDKRLLDKIDRIVREQNGKILFENNT